MRRWLPLLVVAVAIARWCSGAGDEAIDAIEERECTSCLRELVRIDVTTHGQVAATTIATEGRRAAPEAEANVLGILEALGGIDDAAAKRVLEDRSLDLATQILVIQGIGPHPSDAARRRLVAIRQERALEHGRDDFEEGLHRALDEAISASLGS